MALTSAKACGWERDSIIITRVLIIVISIYSLSDPGISSNLIGSQSRSNWALFTPWEMNACSKQNKMAGVDPHFEMSLKSTSNGFLLQMLKSSVQITSCIHYFNEENRGRNRYYVVPVSASIFFILYMWSRLDHHWSNVHQQDHRSGCLLKRFIDYFNPCE